MIMKKYLTKKPLYNKILSVYNSTQDDGYGHSCLYRFVYTVWAKSLHVVRHVGGVCCSSDNSWPIFNGRDKMSEKQHNTWTPENVQLLFKRFSNHLLLRRGLAPYTIEGYCRSLSKVLKDLNTLNPTHDELEGHIAWMYGRKYSYNHLVNTMLAIERFMEFMENPIRFGRPKKPRRIIPATLSEAEIAVMLSGCKNIREKAIISLLAYSGIRNKELCCLKVDHVDLGNNAVRVLGGKGSRDRVVCIPGDCTNVLLRYLNEYPRNGQDYLFTTLKNNNRYGGMDLRKLVKTVAKRAGIKKRVYPHLLRHSLATNLIGRGANLLTVKEQLGHAWIDSTMIYVTSRFQRIMAEYNNFAPSYL